MSKISETTATSRLLENSGEYRESNLKWNDYKSTDTYTVGHANALSDGDEFGKGELNGNVGSATDIKRRVYLKKFNTYNSNNEYDASNA